MSTNRVLLKIKRCKQFPSECAIAAAACLGNYFDPAINYKNLRNLVPASQRGAGIYTSQQASLLNQNDFGKITIVTADSKLADYSWRNLSKSDLIDKMKKLRGYYGRIGCLYSKEYIHSMISWLKNKECDNNLIIDDNYPKYIKRHLNSGRPVGVSFNWTQLFRQKKSIGTLFDDIKGTDELHSAVIRGYDDYGVFIVDSHHKYYKGSLKKYRNGYYKLSWTKLLVSMTECDLLLIY